MTQTFERYEDAYSQLFQAQRALSYSVCKSRSCKNRPKNDPNRSDVSRVDVRCQFGGKPQSRPNKGKYNSSSKKLDCPFEVRIARGQYEPHYSFKVLSLEHNHPPIENHLKCSAFRQASRAEFGRERLAKIVEEKISVGNPSASQVVKQINEEYPQLLLYPADIHHILRDFRTANYGPNTSTHAFVKLLEEDKTKIAHYAIDREQTQQPESATTKPRLTKVIWVFNSQVHLWKNNPEILMIDKTYKANRFNMPLLQIMGMTSLHTTFNVAYVLISDEDPQSFRWVSNQLKKTLRLFNIPEPGIVLTDHDANLKCALDDTFPYVQQQICAWHIVKDVVLQVKRKWSGSSQGRGAAAQGDDDDSDDEDNGERADQDADAGALATAALAQTADLSDASFPITAEGLKDAWLHVMSSPTEEKYMHRWHQLKTAFAQEPQIIDYIDKTYNPFRHQFATFSISKFRNYGIVASVRVESTEETLKQSLKNRFISLDKLLLRTWEAATAQRAMYDTQFDKEMTKYLGRMARDPLLEGIQRKIGSLPLTKLFEQLELVREEEDLGICSQTFSAQWGLPCRHRLDELVDDETPLALSDIDSHWWLRANTVRDRSVLILKRSRFLPASDLFFFLGGAKSAALPAPRARSRSYRAEGARQEQPPRGSFAANTIRSQAGQIGAH